MKIYYNPLDCACKSTVGAIKTGEILQLNIFLLNENESLEMREKSTDFQKKTPLIEECITPSKNAFLHLCKDGEACDDYEMKKTPFGWSISFKIEDIGLYFYSFYVENEGYISCNEMQMGILCNYEKRFLLTVFSPDYETPSWFKGGTMYQIFPDRFCKVGTTPNINGRIARTDWGGIPSYKPNEKGKVLNNDFFGGNFKGIQSKLDYLKNLGITVIYLNPIFEASSNHRYDTSDYMKIDPILGNEQDFKELVEEAEKQGIRVILDGVFNHTGDDSVYFNKYGKYPTVGAYQSKDSPYYSWYSFEKFPEKYSSWWGIDILPEVNEQSEDYQNFIFGTNGVLKNWLKYGIGGYRLDVADELPDFFLKKLRTSVKESNPNAIIIGEVWEDASEKIAYSQRREYLQGYELDSVMNYPLKEGIIQYIKEENATALMKIIRSLIDHYPKQTVDCLMNILGTHDTARILTVLGGIYCKNKDEMAKPSAYLSQENKEIAIKKLKMASVLQYTLPGVPSLYYGDENGMEGHIDPFCRQCFDWEHLNKPLIAFYQKLGELRKKYHNIFKDGDFKEIFSDEGFVFYKREKGDEAVYVYVNNSSKPNKLKLSKSYIDCMNEDTAFENELIIKPYSFGIFTNAN